MDIKKVILNYLKFLSINFTQYALICSKEYNKFLKNE